MLVRAFVHLYMALSVEGVQQGNDSVEHVCLLCCQLSVIKCYSMNESYMSELING